MIPALRAVAAGKPFFSPSVTGVLIEDYVRQLQARGLTDSYHLLTDREREVLQLLAEGRSNKEVAALLDVGVSTVETHRANLMQKLNLHNTAEIVLYAVRKRIIRLTSRSSGRLGRLRNFRHCCRMRGVVEQLDARRSRAHQTNSTSTTNTTRKPDAPTKPASTGLNARPTSDAVVMMPKPVTCASAGSNAPATL